ncbi:LysR family transcriptional regulator (plasmid) [Agrobacterium leguminum]|uniref:LysR family transcriptional regulator n=1 Tax=Agrobacterium leguminum TaxID=2792015 RepID=UPI0030CFBBBA
MAIDAYTLDQFAVFVTIVDQGGFAAAARKMNRAQSAITYAIQKLEDNSGLELFDRSGYRPALTDAGKSLLPRARRILAEVDDWRVQARGISLGLEAKLTVAIVSYANGAILGDVFETFNARFPSVDMRLLTADFQSAARAVYTGKADLGLLVDYSDFPNELNCRACGSIELVAVASPTHPLCQSLEPLTPVQLHDHTQIVLSNLAGAGRDYGVHAVRRWRVNDINAKLELILAGVGWGSMPRPHVADHLSSGVLVELNPAAWEGKEKMPSLTFLVANRRDVMLGPAGRWLADSLVRIVELQTGSVSNSV